MVYRAIGLMSGSSLDGLDIACAEFREQGGKWEFDVLATDCIPYAESWKKRLEEAISLPAKEYLLLHGDYGRYLGQKVNAFIEERQLQFQVALVASHGHTTFHMPGRKMTGQLGDGAAIAAETKLPVITDLRAMDVALGGQGAPIVPIGEKHLLGDYDYFLNLGGIANLSVNAAAYIAFDVCPANRVLNMLAGIAGKEFDEDGKLASQGKVDAALLKVLNDQSYYHQPFPKSLANDFGTDKIFPLVKNAGLPVNDAIRTYSEHIAEQIASSLATLSKPDSKTASRLLATGGGAHNQFLVQCIREKIQPLGIELVIPQPELVNFKEALIMAFIGVLRWRQEENVLASVTGAARDSIGGALWIGQ
jgi:anhydro-N-acetylmuramic acid kinase